MHVVTNMQICNEQIHTLALPSALCRSNVMVGPGVLMSLGGLCVCTGAGRAGSGIGLKALRLLMMWFPTSVLRPKARQSTTVILSGGWRCSFSGNSYRTVTECRFLSCTQFQGCVFHKFSKCRNRSIFPHHS